MIIKATSLVAVLCLGMAYADEPAQDMVLAASPVAHAQHDNVKIEAPAQEQKESLLSSAIDLSDFVEIQSDGFSSAVHAAFNKAETFAKIPLVSNLFKPFLANHIKRNVMSTLPTVQAQLGTQYACFSPFAIDSYTVEKAYREMATDVADKESTRMIGVVSNIIGAAHKVYTGVEALYYAPSLYNAYSVTANLTKELSYDIAMGAFKYAVQPTVDHFVRTGMPTLISEGANLVLPGSGSFVKPIATIACTKFSEQITPVLLTGANYVVDAGIPAAATALTTATQKVAPVVASGVSSAFNAVYGGIASGASNLWSWSQAKVQTTFADVAKELMSKASYSTKQNVSYMNTLMSA